MSEYLWEGDEEAARKDMRDLDDIDRSDHESVANTGVGEEAAQQEVEVVGGEAHKEGSYEK